MDYEAIRYDVEGVRATVELNRPEVRNAINPEMEYEVKDALLRANKDPGVRVIVLTGAGTAFCSGIDLRLHRGRSSQQARQHFESFYWGLHTTHRALDKPTVAVLNGPAREAGCTMAFMCDMILAAESASIGFPAIDRGIVPAYHLVHLPRIVGRLKAFEICFSGLPVPAREAAELGIVNRTVPDERLEDELDGLVQLYGSKPPTVMKIGKELFYRTADMEFEKAMRTVADVVALLASMPDSHEGFGAYVDKRDAVWTP